MTTNIKRLIIFGDSLSDIGVKRNTATGAFAALFGLMRTNQVNRYSDNRNWTDFIWEWAGGQPLIVTDKATSDAAALPHLSWSRNSRQGTPDSAPVYYVNYAEGGAMGGSDRYGVGLGTFREQFERYKADLKKYGPEPGVSLYLIWFGLNDLVTNERKSTDMKPVADQISAICQEIIKLDPNAAFLFGNLPDPQDAVRFMGKEATDKIVDFSKGSFEFGHELAKEIEAHFPKTNPAAVVDLFTPMYHVCKNLGAYGFTKGAQPKGIEVRYGAAPKNAAAAFLTTTSDEAHPTEEVYKVIAQIWASEIRKHFELGTLSQKPDAAFTVKGNN
ncbi:SGNH/GDSL hydrolase family protein [Luteibacter aegosomaticola]|uniref:SGNH/GDSL hydrolase family protein n=1 Tax=Luteibacter aegosomaticola TaxID=2911538 RepID=UPI001FFAE3DA|nr:SGNH/GDSL hydrolase family protein [Luteibacter aegosomaticola]UPG88066.1 SGNH/GDSL hydrolase family protein [Luteibacter aegosomaticola]